MIKYLRLFRVMNLFMIALSMILIRYCLILAAFTKEYNVTGVFPDHLSKLDFILLIISTVLVAAGGYIINDICDVNIDETNKPGKNLIGKSITVQKAKSIYYLFSLIGVLTGFYVALKISMPVIGLLPLFSAVSLWMYSTYYKRRFLSGNFMIALLSALSVLLPGLYEPAFYSNFVYLLWYAVIAFFLSMIRELIKDMEDFDGDELAQCKTAPIVLGFSKTKIIVGLFILVLAVYISTILYKYFYSNTIVNFWYLTSSFMIPLAALMYLVSTGKQKKDYHYASLFTKIIMFAGILTLIPLWYYFLK